MPPSPITRRTAFTSAVLAMLGSSLAAQTKITLRDHRVLNAAISIAEKSDRKM